MEGAFLSTFQLSLILFISILFVLKLVSRTKQKKIKTNLPPFPPKLPVIGNLHQLGLLPHRCFRDLSRKYGDIIMIQLGQMPAPTLVVSSADVVMEMMKTHDLAFSNRPQNTATRILLYGCTDVGFGNYGENWRQKRKLLVVELLNTKRVQSFRLIREQEVAEVVDKLREASARGERHVDLSSMLVSASNDIVCKCAFGRKYDGVKELARKAMIHICGFTVRDYFPLLGFVDVLTGKIKEYKNTFKALDAAFDEEIVEHLKKNKTSQEEGERRKDFVDILIQLQEDGMLGFHFTRNDLKSLMMDMFVGGTDTIAATLEWAMTELMRNPITMKKAQDEVRKVVGHKSKVEENDVNEMHYLKCIIKETLRLHPPAPLVAPRETMSSVKLKGYDIPAKTMVYINAWAIQRDPKFWVRPEEFVPERFENSQIDFKAQDFHFIPFGFGRRQCPGYNFGIVSAEYTLANLLYWFNWELPENDTEIDMNETFGLIVSKKVPLYLKPIPFSF